MHSITYGFVIASASLLVVSAALAQGEPRVIPFDRKVPISERLRENDTSVVVKRNVTVPFVGSGNEKWQEEIDRLNNYETIVVVRVVGAQGEVVDGGTWIRTQLLTQVTQFVKGDMSAARAGLTTISHDGGTVRIGRATVSAGVFPAFSNGEQYLLFLAFDRARNTTYPSAAFHVDARGIIAPLKNSDGSLVLPNSNLIGRRVEEVRAALLHEK